MAKPTVAIRVSPELYQEVFSLAEDRDVSMNEALDMLIYRLRKRGSEQDARSSERRSTKKRVAKRTKKTPKPVRATRKLVEGTTDLYED